MGFVTGNAGSLGYECQYSRHDLYSIVSVRLLELMKASSLPLTPLAPLDWLCTPFDWLSPFSMEGHMFTRLGWLTL